MEYAVHVQANLAIYFAGEAFVEGHSVAVTKSCGCGVLAAMPSSSYTSHYWIQIPTEGLTL